MNQAPLNPPARARALLAVVVMAALVGLLPVLLGSALEAPASVSASLLAVALAALIAGCLVALSGRTPLTMPLVTRAAPPVLAGRITDCTHQPVRPRAPGTA